MAEQSCGGSVQACAMRVAVLEQDGVPVPGASNLYVTGDFTKIDFTPVYTKGVDMEVISGCGVPALTYRGRDFFKRWDLTLELIDTDPELESMIAGLEVYPQGGFSIGGSDDPGLGQIGAPYGVSVEVWSKRIVNGDQDPIWPFIHWVVPRTYWQPGVITMDNNPMPRMYTGYTSPNVNFYNGPLNDWPFPADRQLAHAYTKTIPPPSCGAQALVHS
jgi:hypothetical protein